MKQQLVFLAITCILFSFSYALTPTQSFSITLFQKLLPKNRDKNLIISPLSAYQALSLVGNGGQGKTQASIVETLGKSNQIELNVENQKIIERALQGGDLKLANAVLSVFSPKETFVEIAKKYKALSSKLISVQQVNNWCAENTENKITKIIDSLDGIQMIILNAVYFKSSWKVKFDKTDTHKLEFHNSNGSLPKVDMMFVKEKFLYTQTHEYQAIELPYTDPAMSAIVILPAENLPINEFVESLSDQKMNKILSSLRKNKVQLRLPKFEFEFFSSLKPSLQEMGMELPFNPLKADFSNISDHVKLYIDDVIQKAYIKVDEEGTEAAAVTAVMMKLTCCVDRPQEIIMTVNRPFLFLIRNKEINNQFVFMVKIYQLP